MRSLGPLGRSGADPRPPGVGPRVQPGRAPRRVRAGPGGWAARRLLAPRATPAGPAPLLLSPLSPRRGAEVSSGLTLSPENKGLGCSISMNFVKRFPASKLKCNQSFNRGREGSEKAGNGMTLFPRVRTHCEILPLCCLCSPACL